MRYLLPPPLNTLPPLPFLSPHTTQEQFTLARFFTFPAPVNAAESRLHACIASFLVVAASALSLVRGFHWIWVYMAYGYAARTLCGPRLDPQVRFLLVK